VTSPSTQTISQDVGGRRGHVVWISGYSASGKTTVGREVERLLRERGLQTLFLDGDDLRSIFAQRWGYTREERLELARVYFRLCSHVSSQGISVVISAVAMYDEVRAWLRENVPGVVEVFLDVPEDERRARDGRTKQIYGKIGSQSEMYDPPTAPDVVVDNHGAVTPEEAAVQVVDAVLAAEPPRDVDHGRGAHWDSFYAQHEPPEEPSSFAVAVAATLEPRGRLLEVGCGNGRDAAYFARSGIDVVAIDVSEAAIERCRRRYDLEGLSLHAGDILALPASERDFDVVYSRFCLHAMTPSEEDAFVAEAAARLAPDGRLLIEARSINDPLARKGEVLSRTERIHGHYRRFIVPAELEAKLEAAGLEVRELVETAGVARLGDDDPVVIRVDARPRR
jgi:adenylylsulfate kinase-like enzyme/SAM-dependent methyltransferase